MIGRQSFERVLSLLAPGERCIGVVRAQTGPLSGIWTCLPYTFLTIAVVNLGFGLGSRFSDHDATMGLVVYPALFAAVMTVRWLTDSRNVTIAFTDQSVLIYGTDLLFRTTVLRERLPITPVWFRLGFPTDQVVLGSRTFWTYRVDRAFLASFSYPLSFGSPIPHRPWP